MDSVIYTKFSNERSAQYNIRTDICQDAQGLKYVRKTWDTPEAQSHIAKTYDMYEKLDYLYRGTRLSPNRVQQDGRYLRYEFIQGESMEHYLDEHRDTEAFWNMITDYVDVVRQVYGQEDFMVSKEFQQIFGTNPLPAGLKGSRYIDIDLIFPNLIMDSEKWHVIDYEWTFPFMIPVNYVIYRALFFYKYRNGMDMLSYPLDKLYDKLGITQEEVQAYQRMEACFHQSVFASCHTLGDWVQESGGPSITMDSIRQLFYCDINVWYDRKEEDTQQADYHIGTYLKQGSMECSIPIPMECSKVHLQCGGTCGTIIVKQLYGLSPAGEQICLQPQYSNCDFSDGRVLLTKTSVMEITISLADIDISSLFIRLNCAASNEENQEEMLSMIHGLQDEILHGTQVYRDEIEAMKNSRSWRSTRWMRQLGEILRKR